MTPLPGDRKCFRLINGVLVERTVNDVLPALQTNADGLKEVLESLVKQYRSKQEEMEKWKVGSTMSIRCVYCILTADTLAEEEQCPGCSTIDFAGCNTSRYRFLEVDMSHQSRHSKLNVTQGYRRRLDYPKMPIYHVTTFLFVKRLGRGSERLARESVQTRAVTVGRIQRI